MTSPRGKLTAQAFSLGIKVNKAEELPISLQQLAISKN
jgi:hypothetical protein